MSKNPRDCLKDISDEKAQSIIAFYSGPNSQKQTAKQFGLTMHTLIRLLKSKEALRGKYSQDRNKLVSQGIKKALEKNPEIVAARVKAHTGAKRSLESRKRMQEAAWKRMEKQPNRFISKAELAFGSFLENKLGLKVVYQYRSGLKPFDFLVEDKVLVEFDGPHHYNPDYYMCKSGKVDFQKQQERDAKRKQIADSLGLPLIIVQQKNTDKKGRFKGDAMHEFMYQMGYACA